MLPSSANKGCLLWEEPVKLGKAVEECVLYQADLKGAKKKKPSYTYAVNHNLDLLKSQKYLPKHFKSKFLCNISVMLLGGAKM